ncbi:MAG: hypothetical protein IH950_08310 [Bacteroidetes bacterium]|nr:hypothetical protein [Bacteroidota bacterium]
MWSNILKDREANYTRHVIDNLKDKSWAKPLMKVFNDEGGFISENMPTMFELRFAFELSKAGYIPEYEYNGGVGNSTIDFRVENDKNIWLIELVSLRTSNAANKAIKQVGQNEYRQIFSSEFSDKQTEEDEMITAIQKIGEKVYQNNKIIKFPEIESNIWHMIFIDARGYLDQGGDEYDYRQMAWGKKGIPAECIHYSKNAEGKLEHIKGIFEESCPIKSSEYIRRRIHFLGFVNEREYIESEIINGSSYFFNQDLFANKDEKKAFGSFPLNINRV